MELSTVRNELEKIGAALNKPAVIPGGARAERADPGPSRNRVTLRRLMTGSAVGVSVARMVGQDAQIAVYIMASGRNGTLYTGVTSALLNRVQQHKLGIVERFSKTHGCKRLVWYEDHTCMADAISREKRLKRWRRDWKLALIEAENPQWRDLSDGWFEVADGPLSWTQP